MTDVLKVIGLMSGTSLDGIDAAVLETDGEDIIVPGAAVSLPYDAGLRAALHLALEKAAELDPDVPIPGAPIPDVIADAEQRLTLAHAGAVKALLKRAELEAGEVSYVGFHGQTVLHRPRAGRSWQIGDGAMLARETGIAVVNDFRGADMAAGGQGAPLAALYHMALARNSKAPPPMVVVNIGGVSNVTYIGTENHVLAFDAGPGNAPIDDWAMRHTGEPLDRDGALAAKGAPDQETLLAMLTHPYLSVPPPKSLDRHDFGFEAVSHLSPEDGAATLTVFTAAAIARADEHFPRAPRGWIVTGGGRHNPELMKALCAVIHAPVIKAEQAGWRGDFLEAEAFAYLAMRSVRGLPLSLPSTTGVPEPTTGGTLHRPNEY